MIRKLLGVELRKLTWLEKTWLAGPVLIWFGYHPVISIGRDATSYYELSLASLYLVILALVGLPNIWRKRQQLLRSQAVRLTGAFVLLSGLTLLWTHNPLRGVLTFGIIGALFLVLLAGLAERQRLKALLRPLVTLLLASAVVVSILALIQMIAGMWLPRGATLLCLGCAAEQFGFVRPNVFAIEPQFLGSLLLAPLLIMTHLLLGGRRDRWLYAGLFLVSAVLFLTLSRGAIVAFAFGACLLFVLHRRELKRIGLAALLFVVSLAFALSTQGLTAALNRTVDTTFMQAVSSSVNHLSLGLIELPDGEPAPSDTGNTPPKFDGYVEESTDVRLNRSQLALGTWSASPQRMLFGVGLGGSGVAMHERYPDDIGAREIVQNEYLEVLLEYGLLGLALFAAIIAALFYTTRRHKWVWALLAAYLVQWVFFSGYPNALHIYLTLITVFVVFGNSKAIVKT